MEPFGTDAPQRRAGVSDSVRLPGTPSALRRHQGRLVVDGRLDVPWAVARAVLGSILAATHRLRFEGLENIPASGGAVVSGNHISVLDPFVVGLAVAGTGPKDPLPDRHRGQRPPRGRMDFEDTGSGVDQKGGRGPEDLQPVRCLGPRRRPDGSLPGGPHRRWTPAPGPPEGGSSRGPVGRCPGHPGGPVGHPGTVAQHRPAAHPAAAPDRCPRIRAPHRGERGPPMPRGRAGPSGPGHEGDRGAGLPRQATVRSAGRPSGHGPPGEGSRLSAPAGAAAAPPPGARTRPDRPVSPRDPFRSLLALTRRQGDVARYRSGGEQGFLVSSPEHIRHVLAENSGNYTKATSVNVNFKGAVADGLLTSEGPSGDGTAGSCNRPSTATGSWDLVARSWMPPSRCWRDGRPGWRGECLWRSPGRWGS